MIQRKILQVSPVTSKVIGEYTTIAEAARELGVDESTIRKRLNHPTRTCKGYRWVTSNVVEKSDVKEPSTEFLSSLNELGITEENLGLVWAKQDKKGNFRYSISFKKGDNLDITKITDSFKESVKEIIPTQIQETISNKKILLVYTSDKHLGAKTNENSLFSNPYNKEEFELRVEKLIREILKLKSEFGKFEKVIIVDLGDAVDGLNGQTTRGGHNLPQNMGMEDVFDLYFKTHKRLFDCLVSSEVANKFEFRAMSNDNHSGAVGHLVYRGLEIYLNAAYPEIYTEISDKFITHFECEKHVFILSHGKDREDRSKGLPLTLDEKSQNFISSYMDYYEIIKPVGFVHFIKGDLHQSSSQLVKKFRYRNCLSMYGASSWIQHNFGGNTIAGVSMDIINEDDSRILEFNLIF